MDRMEEAEEAPRVSPKKPITLEENVLHEKSTTPEDGLMPHLAGYANIDNLAQRPMVRQISSGVSNLVSDVLTQLNSHEKNEMLPVSHRVKRGEHIKDVKTLPTHIDNKQDTVNTNEDPSSDLPVKSKISRSKSFQQQEPLVNLDVPAAFAGSMSSPEILNTDGNTLLHRLTADEVADPETPPNPHYTRDAVLPKADEAIAIAPASKETVVSHEEMSKLTPTGCPFLTNKG
jgi:hypothetical protein